MSSQQLDEEAIVEVAREIRKPDIRAKYLDQVCADHELRSRLEQKCKVQRRWQFGMRTLLVAMVVAALLSTGLAVSYRQSMLAEQARLQAIAAQEAALQLYAEQQAASAAEGKL